MRTTRGRTTPSLLLHVTNGDSARLAIERLRLPGRVLVWADVLHEGPVPAELSPAELRRVRARYIGEQGWASEDEAARELERRDVLFSSADALVLWFEHDLYDQLQLLQVLDLLGETAAQAELVQSDRFLVELGDEELRALYERRAAVTTTQLESARCAWRAFRSPDPSSLNEYARAETPELPFLASALRRHLEQFPAVGSGLARTERHALEAIREGARHPAHVFAAAQSHEEAPFMGDAVFWRYLERLEPLLVDEAGALRLGEAGEAVLAGRADLVELLGVDRWLGGVHLHGRSPRWRWSGATGGVVATS
ncbi:MAG: DUF1835 domain-containing protein [Actinomycetota bacterium]|nr:DUF1835 domain-containing protein [Actinomycetota bacterium]